MYKDLLKWIVFKFSTLFIVYFHIERLSCEIFIMKGLLRHENCTKYSKFSYFIVNQVFYLILLILRG